MTRCLLLAALGAALGACDRGEDADRDPVVTPTPIAPETTGRILGRVSFSGTPPANLKLPVGGNAECAALHDGPVYDEAVLVKNGRLQNALVYVKSGLERFTFAWPTAPVQVANEGCIYVPRVAGVQTNQPIEFVNHDPTAHNIHGFSSQGDFNFTLLGKGLTQRIKLRSPELVLRVKCDLHPWMKGFVGVFAHPFFQVTGPDGAFELKGLPAGEYELEAWHETLGTSRRNAKLDAQGTLNVEFEFPGK